MRSKCSGLFAKGRLWAPRERSAALNTSAGRRRGTRRSANPDQTRELSNKQTNLDGHVTDVICKDNRFFKYLSSKTYLSYNVLPFKRRPLLLVSKFETLNKINSPEFQLFFFKEADQV